jgi:hypothetical protein
MTDNVSSNSARLSVGRILACLPTPIYLFLYWYTFPVVTSDVRTLPPFQHHMSLEWQESNIPHVVFFVLVLCAYLYQRRFQRTWVESIFFMLNLIWTILLGLGLLMVIFDIDPMPRTY